MAQRLSAIVEKNSLLKGINFHFQAEMSIIHGIKELQLIIGHSQIKNKKLCAVLIDIKKAYNSLETIYIIKALK